MPGGDLAGSWYQPAPSIRCLYWPGHHSLLSYRGRPLSGPFPLGADLSPHVWMLAYPLLTSSLVPYMPVLPTTWDVHRGHLSPLQLSC